MRVRNFLLSVLIGTTAACAAPTMPSGGGRHNEGGGSSSAVVGGDSESTNPTSSTETKTGGKSASTLASGCTGGDKPSGLLKDQSIEVDGVTRSYQLEVPTNYDPAKPYPIVWVFHGDGGWADQNRTMFGFSRFAADDAIFVYPNGLGQSFDLESPPETNKDVALFDRLTAMLASNYCVDTSRVFATGFSNGAFFSNQLACMRGDKLRGIASHSGGGPYGPNSQYENGHLKCTGPAPAALIVHGTLDPIVGPNDGRQSIQHWTWANECEDSTTASSPSPCVAYDGCKEPVQSCIIPGMGHILAPGATEKTWSFFSGL